MESPVQPVCLDPLLEDYIGLRQMRGKSKEEEGPLKIFS
jgi:hypothetical protein